MCLYVEHEVNREWLYSEVIDTVNENKSKRFTPGVVLQAPVHSLLVNCITDRAVSYRHERLPSAMAIRELCRLVCTLPTVSTLP